MTLYHKKKHVVANKEGSKQDYTQVDYNKLDDPLPLKNISGQQGRKQDYTQVDYNRLDDPLPLKNHVVVNKKGSKITPRLTTTG